jgi:uncharacterized membrane protein YidH (DUF202 family)
MLSPPSGFASRRFGFRFLAALHDLLEIVNLRSAGVSVTPTRSDMLGASIAIVGVLIIVGLTARTSRGRRAPQVPGGGWASNRNPRF